MALHKEPKSRNGRTCLTSPARRQERKKKKGSSFRQRPAPGKLNPRLLVLLLRPAGADANSSRNQRQLRTGRAAAEGRSNRGQALVGDVSARRSCRCPCQWTGAASCSDGAGWEEQGGEAVGGTGQEAHAAVESTRRREPEEGV